jgi:acyl carrier protein
MANLEVYQEAFKKLFNVDNLMLTSLVYQGIPEWDSIGHMELMTIIEKAFSIEIDIDDIIDFSSFENGKSILSKYGIEFKNE